ncbi:MAG: O-antigen ligase family protein [Mycetocola sp.]
MPTYPVRPLTRGGRVARSVLVTALLLGSLFPPVFGVSPVLAATVIAIPVIAFEILRFLPRIHPVVWFVIPLFGFFAAHALFVVPVTDYGDDKLQKWITVTVVSALAACLLRDRRTLYTFSWSWVVGAGILALLTIAGYDGGRADLFGSNPIWLARALAAGIIMMVWLRWEKAAKSWPTLLIVGLLGAGILASGSRGPLLAVIVGVGVMTLFSQRGRVWKIMLIIVGCVVAAWAVLTLPFFENSRFATLLENGDTDQTRDLYREITLRIIGENPGGVGFGNWSIVAGHPRHLWPHNIFLEVFAELGWLQGTVLVVTLVTLLAVLATRARVNRTTLLVLALLSAETLSVSISGDLNARTFWFMLTLAFLYATNTVLAAESAATDLPRTKSLVS